MHNNTLDLVQERKQLQKSSSIKNKNGYFENSKHNFLLILFRIFQIFQLMAFSEYASRDLYNSRMLNLEWGIKEWNGEWNEESVKPGIVKAGMCKTRSQFSRNNVSAF